MIQVWCYDENKILKESIIVEELGENMTTISPNGLGLYCKKFDCEKWVEGWTQEQINEWVEANSQPQEPCEMEILKAKVKQLEDENAELTSLVTTMALM